MSDLARGVVFRWFAQPLLRRNRARVYAAVREELRYLDRHPDAPDRAERIQAMVASSEPLVRLIGQRIRRGADNAPLLEVLTRRYYGNHQLADVTARDVAGCRFVTAEDASRGRVTLVAATAADIAALPGALAALATLAGQSAAGCRRRRPGRRPVRHLGRAAGRPTRSRCASASCWRPAPRHRRPRRAGRSRGSPSRSAAASGIAMQHHFTFRPASAADRGAWPRTG